MNFTVLSMELFITLCLPFFFQTDATFYQMILSQSLGRGTKDSLIKIPNAIRDKALRKDITELLIQFKGAQFRREAVFLWTNDGI